MNWQSSAYDENGNIVEFDEKIMKPKSAWKKSLIIEQLLSLGMDASIVKKCSADTLKKTTLVPACTRAAGRYSAQISYYRVNPELTDDDLKKIATIVPEPKRPEEQLEIVKLKLVSYGRSGLPEPERIVYAVKKNNYAYFEDGHKKRINGTSMQIAATLPNTLLVPAKYRTAVETTLFYLTHKL